MKILPVAFIFFMFLLSIPAGAQAPSGEINSSEIKPYSPIIAENENRRLKIPISLRAEDASLSEVLKVLSSRSSMNFVAGEGVRVEKITIILDRTPLDEAIDLLVRAAGLTYEIIGNSVLIGKKENLKDEVGFSAYVVQLKYASAPEVVDMLSDLTKNIKVDQGGNRLICYTSPRVINEIERIIRSIDHPHIQVLLDVRMIEVSMDKLKEYGVDWAKMDPVQTSLFHPAAPMTQGYNVNNWLQGEVEFPLVLRMMSQNGDARTLMNTKLTTTNNREAHLHIGEVIPYTIQSYNLSTAGGANLQVQKEEVGVKVSMTPHVNDDQQITLTIDPEVSSIIGFKGANNDMPMTRKRTTHTSVRLQDGQTVFLAGLISEEKSVDVAKLPILGDIPLIGRIFQKRKETFKKANLIMEVTPHILRSDTKTQTGMGETPGQAAPADSGNINR